MKTLLIKANGITNARRSGVISGVGRSTQKLLSALNKLNNIPFEIKVYVDGTSGFGFDFYGWRFKHFIFPVPVKWGNELTSVEPLFRKRFIKYDLLHIPHNDDWVWDGERFVVTMHDVFEYDVAVKMGNQYIIDKWKKMAEKSLGIVTCSEFSKNEIIKRFHVPTEKISVVYWGTSTDIFYVNEKDDTARTLGNLGVEGKYFVSISCAHPRKNIRILLKAYRMFVDSCDTRRPSHKLVLVWNNPPKEILDEYSKEIESGLVVFLGSVSDDNLRALYNGASCTMFPTRAEGFGFPILESFACNTPVMTCRNTCLEEVGQDAAIYVGEDDVEAMANVMKMFEEGLYNRRDFELAAKRITTMFTWENTAKKYVEFYKRYL